MPRYIDGFVLPLPKRNLAVYRRMAGKGGKIWQEHGALDYVECVLEDDKAPWCLSFPRGIRAKAGETIVFAFITYKSRAHRDRVNAKVMADPRLQMPELKTMPFDVKRMLYGGFTAIVDRGRKRS